MTYFSILEVFLFIFKSIFYFLFAIDDVKLMCRASCPLKSFSIVFKKVFLKGKQVVNSFKVPGRCKPPVLTPGKPFSHFTYFAFYEMQNAGNCVYWNFQRPIVHFKPYM